MSREFAKALSIVFSPPLLLGAMVILVGLTDPDPHSIAKALVMLALGLVIPSILYFYDYFRDNDHNFTPFREERHLMYLGAVLGFALAGLVFGMNIIESDKWFGFSMLLTVLFTVYYLVNRYFDKASLHIGLFAFVVMVLMAHVSSLFVVAFILAPHMILSRIRMRKHEWIEVMWGWTIGLTAGLISWFI